MKRFEKCKRILAFLLVTLMIVQQGSITTLADELSVTAQTVQNQEETTAVETPEEKSEETPGPDMSDQQESKQEEQTEITQAPQAADEEITAAPDSEEASESEEASGESESSEETEETAAGEVSTTEEKTESASGQGPSTPATIPWSDNLNQFITAVEVEGAVINNGKYQIEADQDYTLKLSFAENRTLQFEDNGTLYYTLPEGLTLTDSFAGGVHNFDIGDLKNNTFIYDAANNRLVVSLNTADTENYEKYKEAANAQFQMELGIRFNENVTQIDFSDNIKLDVKVNTAHSLAVTKQASYDSTNGCVNYEITVKSIGNNHMVEVRDTLSGTLVKMYTASDVNTIWSNKKGDLKGSITPSINGKTMSLTIPSMEADEEIYIKYSAKVDYDQVAPETVSTIENTKNTVAAKSTEATNEVSTDGGIEGNKMYTPLISKSANKQNSTIAYTITVNENCRYDVSGKEIKDTITKNADYMKFSGSGITVKKYDSDGNQVGTDESLSWSQLGIDPKTAKSWRYTLPSEAGKYKYVITYTAETSENNTWGNVTVTNRAEYTDGSNGSNKDVTLSPSYGTFNISKSGQVVQNESTQKKQIQWKIVFDTVANKSYKDCWLDDTLPNTWIDNKAYSDSLIENSVEITGLTDSEGYEIEKYAGNNAINKFKVKFYYMQDGQKIYGLKTLDTKRTITITYLTDPDQTWFDRSDADHYREHKNTARLYTDGKDSYFTRDASVDLYKRNINIEKNGYIQNTDNNGLSVIRYEVVVTGIDSDSITIQDIFDKDQLVYYTDNNLKATIGFDNYRNFNTDRGGKLTYTETDEGAQFTISDIPRNSHGDYYPNCRLTYYLKVNGQAGLEDIASTMEGGKVKNTAKIADKEATNDVAVSGITSPITKDMIEGNASNGYVATYTLTINEDQRKYGTEEYLNVDDVMENVWLTDIKSMNITTVPAENKDKIVFTMDEASNSLHFKVPNETKVIIEYKAKWNGKGNINHKNTASVFGYTSAKERWVDVSASGSGTFSNYEINLYKSDAENSLKGLAGAVFKLQEFIGNAWSDVTRHDGSVVTVTTGSDGNARIRGHQNVEGWVLYPNAKYRLVEVQAPDGYEKLSEEESPVFTISTDGKHGVADGTVYYSNGDTIYVSDRKLPDVEISKIDAVNKKELAGATLKVTDAAGNLVESWESGTDKDADGNITPHKVSVTAGTYTLTEVTAPEGYSTAQSITFEVGSDGKVTVDGKEVKKVTMTDEPISVSVKKTDIVDGRALAGAKLQILDKDKNIVTSLRGEKLEWTSTTDAKVIEGLKAGETYYLHEETAPTGYTVANDTQFVLKADGTVDSEKTTTVVKDGILLVQDSMIKSEKATVKVTKTLVYNGMELGAPDQTFYVALYGDEACTNRISDVKTLVFKNTDSATAEFKDLEIGRKYYVSECDAEGTAQTSGTLADAKHTIYIANFQNGNSVTVDKADETKEITFQNEFMNIPDGFYKVGKLNITKKLLGADGELKNSNDTFYAGIFDDAEFTKLSENVSQNIVALEMGGNSSVSAQVKVSVADGQTVTLYVTEVDANGNPVDDAENFRYEVSVDSEKVVFDESNMERNVTIVNKETEEEEKTVIEKTEITPTPSISSSTEESVTTSTRTVKTGDNTPIAVFVLLLAAAVAVIAFCFIRSRKKKN